MNRQIAVFISLVAVFISLPLLSKADGDINLVDNSPFSDGPLHEDGVRIHFVAGPTNGQLPQE